MIERHHPEAVKDLLKEGYRPSLIAHYLSQRKAATVEEIADMLKVSQNSAVALASGGRMTMTIANPKDVETYNRLEMRFASLVCQYTVGK
jgi:hypothetical protein